MTNSLAEASSTKLNAIAANGLLKHERVMLGPQSRRVTIQGATTVDHLLNLCANNYLGLADHPDVIAAAQVGLERYGFGMASVRFICGTQDIHRELEKTIAQYVGKADAILFAACFDANGGVFETLLGEEDAVISDSLNHASIIDGIRLSKAKRYRFTNGDMNALETALQQAKQDGCRLKLIVTDGVFSMDGYLADLHSITRLAEHYEASLMVDDCHATGFIGPQGRGTPARAGVTEKVDIITGTLGKALGGAMGGYVAASQPVIDLLRQRSRPYLFSNSLAPALATGALKAIQLAIAGDDLRQRLFANAAQFRTGLEKSGFSLLPGETPIIPVMLNDAERATAFANELYQHGVLVTAFTYPVVPVGKARIRTQMSAAHTPDEIDFAIQAFTNAGQRLAII